MYFILLGASVSLSVDNLKKHQTAMNSIHDLLGLDISQLTIGGNVNVLLQDGHIASGNKRYLNV